MYRPRLLLSVLLLLCQAAGARATAAGGDQAKVDSSLKFIAHVESIHVNIDQQPLVDWVKPIFEVLDKRFQSETKPRTVVVEVTLHPDGPADVLVGARPALADADVRAIQKAADTSRSPHSRVVDATFRIEAKLNGGTPEKSGPFTPPLPSPGDRKLARFKPASTKEKLALIESWARNEAIPLLGEFARRRDRLEHQATRDFGKLLASIKRDGPIDVPALSEKNDFFWRAMIEAPSGDQLVPAAWVALCAANGQLDYARRIADAIEPFSAEGFGSSELLREFRWRVQLFDQDLEERIQKGIALNDDGHYDEAIKVYDSVLADDPASAWAHYELFQSKVAKSLKSKTPVALDWPAARKAILQADPLYGSMASAESPDELYDLLLRREIQTLFSDEHNATRDIFRYADIARDLGQPGFAAMLYWNAKRSIKPDAHENRNLTADALYCLEMLGVIEVKTKFPGDHAAEFKRLDAERAKRKKESPARGAIEEPKKN